MLVCVCHRIGVKHVEDFYGDEVYLEELARVRGCASIHKGIVQAPPSETKNGDERQSNHSR